MRTRMYGGVTGKASDGLPMSIVAVNSQRLAAVRKSYGTSYSGNRSSSYTRPGGVGPAAVKYAGNRASWPTSAKILTNEPP